MRQNVITNIDVLGEAIQDPAQRCHIEKGHRQSKHCSQQDGVHSVCGCDRSQRKCYRHDDLCNDWKNVKMRDPLPNDNRCVDDSKDNKISFALSLHSQWHLTVAINWLRIISHSTHSSKVRLNTAKSFLVDEWSMHRFPTIIFHHYNKTDVVRRFTVIHFIIRPNHHKFYVARREYRHENGFNEK